VPAFLGYVAVLLLVSACGLNDVLPVEVSQAGDDRLDCAQLQAQMRANAEVADELRAAGDRRLRGVFWPPSLTLDAAPDPAGRLSALDARNRRLLDLSTRRGCPEFTVSRAAPYAG
jgi:hypothetical protein